MSYNNLGWYHELTRNFDKYFFEKSFSFQIRIIGLIQIIGGIVAFYLKTSLYIKLGITLIIIGAFFLLLPSDKKTNKRFNNAQMVLILGSCTTLIFFVTFTFSFDMFFLIITLGITLIKELTNELITNEFKKKLNIFLFLFSLIFIAIIAQKILNVFNI